MAQVAMAFTAPLAAMAALIVFASMTIGGCGGPGSPSEITVTPSSPFWSWAAPGVGLRLIAHVLPFQCSVSVLIVVPDREQPTAHAFDEEEAATP
jgi:hypothetical protein